MFGITLQKAGASIRRRASIMANQALGARVLRAFHPEARLAPAHHDSGRPLKEHIMAKKTPVSTPMPSAPRERMESDPGAEANDREEFRKSQVVSGRATRKYMATLRKKSA